MTRVGDSSDFEHKKDILYLAKFGVLWFKMCLTDYKKVIAIGGICYEQEHYNLSLNSEFDRNIVNSG